jgi:hypothetical protein
MAASSFVCFSPRLRVKNNRIEGAAFLRRLSMPMAVLVITSQ